MKRLGLIMVFLFALSALWAGGGGQPQTAPPSGATTTTIRIMGYGGQDPAIVSRLLNEVIGADLRSKNIELVYEPLEGDYNAALFNALSAGTAADIFYIPVETAPGIIATGRVLPLNGLLDASPFISTLNEAFTVDGNLDGIAKDFNTLALFYNKDIFDEAGVPYPTENETWDSLADKARRISALGPEFYGLALPGGYDRFGAFAFAAGWQPFGGPNGRTNLLDPNFISAVEWYTNLVKEGVGVLPSDIGQGWGGGAFATERVGMAFEGAWMIGFLRNEAPNLEYGSTFMPRHPRTGQRGNFLYTVAYGINSTSPHREAALEVLKALTSDKAQQFILEEGLAIPSRTALSNNPYFNQPGIEPATNRVIFQGASDGNVLGFQFGRVGTDWMTPVNSILSEVMTGQSTLNAALQRAQQDMDALLNRAGM